MADFDVFAAKEQFGHSNTALDAELTLRASRLLTTLQTQRRALSAEEDLDLQREDEGLSSYTNFVHNTCKPDIEKALLMCRELQQVGWMRAANRFLVTSQFADLVIRLQIAHQDASRHFAEYVRSCPDLSPSIRQRFSAPDPAESNPHEDVRTDIACAIAYVQQSAMYRLQHDMQEISTLLQVSDASERRQIVENVLVPSGNAEIVEYLRHTFDELTSARSRDLLTEVEAVMRAQQSLRAVLVQLEEQIPLAKIQTDFTHGLGKGVFGEVFSGSYRPRSHGSTALSVAVKVLDVHPNDVKQHCRDLQALRTTTLYAHPNMVHYYGYTKLMLGSKACIAVVLELCQASLDQVIAEPCFAAWTKRIAIVQQIASGMSFLANIGMVHNSLRPQNVLFRPSKTAGDAYGDVVLADFGLEMSAERVRTREDKTVRRFFKAPELTRVAASQASDVFAFGVTAAFALQAAYPYQPADGSEPRAVTADLLRDSFYSSLQTTDQESHAIVELLCRCCEVDPAQRPRFATLEAALCALVGTAPPRTSRRVNTNSAVMQLSSLSYRQCVRLLSHFSGEDVSPMLAETTFQAASLARVEGVADLQAMGLTLSSPVLRAIVSELRPLKASSGLPKAILDIIAEPPVEPAKPVPVAAAAAVPSAVPLTSLSFDQCIQLLALLGCGDLSHVLRPDNFEALDLMHLEEIKDLRDLGVVFADFRLRKVLAALSELQKKGVGQQLLTEVNAKVEKVMASRLDNKRIKQAVQLWCSDRAAAVSKYGEIATWDTARVTDMKELFSGQSTFNDSIDAWDVSNVTNMSGMFLGATAFNQPLASWNVSKVTDLSYMFHGATAFNQPLDMWNISDDADMSNLFGGCTG